MKVEIKKIHILSVLFSVFPLAVFVVMLVSAFLEMFSPEATLNFAYVMGLVLRAVQGTILSLVSVIFFLLAYNGLAALGIRGVQVNLEDKE
ncbi:MAG: hypothetical protein IKP96_00590 [Elusimicrobiaceae bacterium]|nr:hypothetical protein [Elusimicrobiaceae bacterium]